MALFGTVIRNAVPPDPHRFRSEYKTVLDKDFLNDSFSEQLLRYYHKFDKPQHKARVLQLLAGLTLDDRTKSNQHANIQKLRRPKTAMAAIGRAPEVAETTYRRYYGVPPHEEQGPQTADVVETSTPGQEGQYQRKMTVPTYVADYTAKPIKRTKPIRAGSASGQRRNNPHPNETFMIWRFPGRSNQATFLTDARKAELTDEIMDQVCQDTYKSTYQSDYLGIPQGVQVKSAIDIPDDPKKQIPYTLDSTIRYSYQKREQPGELQGNVTRYGCNKKKMEPAAGSVPTVSPKSVQMHLQSTTSYSRDYGSTQPWADVEIKQLLKEYSEKAKGIPEKKAIRPFVRSNTMPVGDTRQPQVNKLSWLSAWTGPQ